MTLHGDVFQLKFKELGHSVEYVVRQNNSNNTIFLVYLGVCCQTKNYSNTTVRSIKHVAKNSVILVSWSVQVIRYNIVYRSGDFTG